MYRCRGIIQKLAGVAQLVEQRIRNAWVGSSTLSAGTNLIDLERLTKCAAMNTVTPKIPPPPFAKGGAL